MNSAAPVVFRLSPLQKSLWGSPDLRNGSVYGRALVEGQPDWERLQQCFRQVAERHESLRTLFQLSPGFTLPFQVISGTPDFSWEEYELTHKEEGHRNTEVQKLLEYGSWPVATPFDGPTFGVKIIRISPERSVVALRASALCCDTASLQNLISEVAQKYQNQSVEEAVQYADFSEWHNDTLLAAGEESIVAKDFWSHADSAQQAPLTSKKPSASQYPMAHYKFSIDPAVFRTEHQKAEPFLLTCWQTLIWRLSNQESITIDVRKAGRPLDELQLSIGLFSRPFPLSVSFESQSAFETMLQRTTDLLSDVERWQAYCPFGTSSVIGFEYLQLPARTVAGPLSLTITDLEPLHGAASLLLSCRLAGEVLSFELLYDASLYAVNDIARIGTYFDRVVRAAAEHPDAKVCSFNLMDEDERKQVLQTFNSDRAEYGDQRPFHQLFEEQVSLTPDRPAVAFEDVSLTYAELNTRSNQIASWLRQGGVTPNTPVGLCLERSAEMIIGLMGILKAGGAYVPLLPDLPAARLAHQVTETGLKIIVSTQLLLERLSEVDARVLCLDRDRTMLEKEPSSNLPHIAGSEDLIYILYTSGSTGVPKGVAVRHGNVTNYVHGITRRLNLQSLSNAPGLTFGTVSTLGADLGNTSIFPALVSGGLLVIIGYDAAIDGGLFAQHQRKRPIDILKITPSNLSALLATEAAENILPRKMLIVGGEACTWDLAERVAAAGVCSMMNHYGPTETTIGCLTFDISGELATGNLHAGIVPIGRPLPNAQVYVLDSELRPVPVGVSGEICISGAGVTKGYIGRPEETAARFVPHPFLSNDGLLYRSGDFGRHRPDGSIEFLGRVDEQVKIRGHRVELTEIESLLNVLSEVQHSIVLLSQDDTGDYLCAYLVVSSEISPTRIQEHLRQHLPEHMVPRDFVVLEQMPLNANGKVDRRKLAELKPGAVEIQSEVIAPRNEIEEKLVAIWKETLHREQISVRANFFDLGGHSLLATQIVARIRSGLGINVSIRMLFEAPTIETLALAIDTMRVDTSEDAEITDLLAELEGLSDLQSEEILRGE